MKLRATRSRPLVNLGLGAIVLAAGLVAAHLALPEWRLQRLPPRADFVARYRAVANRLGVHLALGEPQTTLSTVRQLDQTICPGANRTLSVICSEARVTVKQTGSTAAEPLARELVFGWTATGEERSVIWVAPTPVLSSRAPIAHPPVELFASSLLRPGEALGLPRPLLFGGSSVTVYPLAGASPPHHLMSLDLQQQQGFLIGRVPGSAEETVSLIEAQNIWLFLPRIATGVGGVLGAFATGILFLVLWSRRRIDFVNGAILGLVILAITAPVVVSGGVSWGDAATSLMGAALRALGVFVVWSVGESLLRTADSTFTTSLDSLRAGRLGPRGGQSLLNGLALGAGLAGLTLAIYAASASLRGLWPERASLRLPVFAASHDPIGDGIILAGGIVLLLAAARRIVPARWAPPTAALAGAFFFGPVQIHPYPLELAANFVLISLLVLLARRGGLTAVLTAAISSLLLPAAAFSGLHLEWLSGSFTATASLLTGLLIVGLVGLSRPAQREEERLRAPAFMRRIEEEQRIKYEMNLLARMQEGLLPGHPPDLPGWDLAARSILATEAGGDLYDFLVDDAGKLWVAAGDVAGHGYSCAIVQAMTTAALSSLISPEKTPAEVLRRVDRVIRRGAPGKTSRNFTTLALLRLDPETGEVLLSNAGHPSPFLVIPGEAGEVTEIELPGLPLGQGPARTYRDHYFRLAPGSALVFCSDGLFESSDAREEQYGYDRPLEVLRGAAHASAGGILDSLFAGWRRHLGREEPPDDTTVVVVKRMSA
ncbi:MAG TPA: PP2C family protein-serine/threonine phosphatase [Thermoanaerobaculia bacterium]|jgi:sigma-B regulation protein RsbU (phosphoserine phosphatase)|nr:PP2C family protein-serine/threonine phosphatase [Thermoanaerobaculia bacterium]